MVQSKQNHLRISITRKLIVKSLLLNQKVLRAGIMASTLVPSLSLAADTTDTSCADVNGGQNLTIQNGANCAKGTSNSSNLFGSGGIFHTIADTLIFIVGAVAVIMLIIGGLRYVISQGSKEGVASAKDTILYSIIGIVVAILAYAIVNFVTGSLAPSSSNGG
jgi:hypothetical protein